jgi:hypothetical protein
MIRFVLSMFLFTLCFTIPSFSSERVDCDSIPLLNQKIISYVRTTIGTKVGHGECWDLAAQALNQNQALWDHKYKFGREINPARECVYPGDIIQFEGVLVRFSKGPRNYQETMEHHTAIVYEVKEKGVFVLIHQNTVYSGRKVGLSELDLKTIVRGKIKIYRPVN